MDLNGVIYWFPCRYNRKLTENLITWYKFTFAENLKRQSKSLFQGWFPLTRFWLRMLTPVNFNHVNKIGPRYKVLRLKLHWARFCFYAYKRPFIHCLYFICERKFYARRHVKITRQWKSTLNERDYISPLWQTAKDKQPIWPHVH